MAQSGGRLGRSDGWLEAVGGWRFVLCLFVFVLCLCWLLLLVVLVLVLIGGRVVDRSWLVGGSGCCVLPACLFVARGWLPKHWMVIVLGSWSSCWVVGRRVDC